MDFQLRVSYQQSEVYPRSGKCYCLNELGRQVICLALDEGLIDYVCKDSYGSESIERSFTPG